MKVSRLKALLERIIKKLENFNESSEIKTVTNTYFLGDCSYFLGLSSEGYVNLDDIDIEDEEGEIVTLHDVDLCINIYNNSIDDEKLMQLDALERLCKSHDVVVKVEQEIGPNGWPTFMFEGFDNDIADVLEVLGMDEDMIDDLLDEAMKED